MTQSINGVLIIDKPSGLTSHDVVYRVRRILQQRDVGHLGTLDPSATGVLPLVLGNMTRLAQFYLKSEKSYEGVIRFGFATDTYDAAGEPASEPQPLTFTLGELREISRRFQGAIKQAPPPFSAKKIQGIPAYKLARKKKHVAFKPVQVEVRELELFSLDNSRVWFRTRVSSGTYVRSIAHDLGQAAGCGAHLDSLRRTAVAEFTLEDAQTLEQLQRAVQSGGPESMLVHPRKLLPSVPAVTATDEITSRIRNGRPVNLPEFSSATEVKVFHGQRDLVAIAARIAGTLFQPKIVFV